MTSCCISEELCKCSKNNVMSVLSINKLKQIYSVYLQRIEYNNLIYYYYMLLFPNPKQNGE